MNSFRALTPVYKACGADSLEVPLKTLKKKTRGERGGETKR